MSKALTCLGAGLMAALATFPSTPVSAQGYESPPTFSAAKVLPPDLLQSPYHKIVGPVTVQGFLNRYQMQTKYGTFTVEGTELLRMRVHEVAATAELEKVNSAETLVASAGRTALKPIGTAKDLVTAPGKTVGEAWKGVGGWFNRVDASMSATDPNREGTVASLTGGSKARRKLAFDLGVDPYTTFEPLNAELTRVASASAVGETGVNIGLAFVTGGAGIAISVGGTTSTVREVLRDKTAAELEQLGREKLAAMGVSPGTVNAFYATQGLTPTDKAVIVASLMSLGIRRRPRSVHRPYRPGQDLFRGLRLSAQGRAHRRLRQARFAGPLLLQRQRHAGDADRGRSRRHRAHGLCLLEPWSRAARFQHRGARPDLDHRQRESACHRLLGWPRLEDRAQSRRQAREITGPSATAARRRCPTGRCRPAST